MMVAGPRFEILHGDALERLAAMEAGTIDGIVTSPPYADQRAYGGSSPDEFADPFMGSGTTLVAAVETGRPAVGIEVHEEYRVEAAQRVGRRLSEVHAEKEEAT